MKNIIFILFVLFTRASIAQNINQQLAKTAGINMVVGGAIGGIGAMINKKPGERNINVFLKQFGIGAVGGGICYVGKSMLYQTTKRENLNIVWPARIINSIGSSIIENAASNQKFYNSFALDMWIFRLDLKDNFSRVQVRAKVGSVISLISLWAIYGKLDVERTLLSGSAFLVGRKQNSNNLYYFEQGVTTAARGGLSAFNVIIVNESYANYFGENIYSTISHELVHTFQHREILSFNKYFNKLDSKMKGSFKIYNQTSRFVFLDFNVIDLSLYGLSNILEHSRNPIEKEAYLLGEHIYW